MKNEMLLPKVLQAFFLSLLLATVGAGVGTFVPPVLFLPLVIVELVLILVVLFVRKNKKVGYGILYLFTFISGITTYPVIQHYAEKSGADLVIMAFLTTTIMFGGLALYAWKSKRDFRPLFGFLFISLLGLIVIAILNIFFQLPDMMMMVYGGVGVLVFSGWVLYDISSMKYDEFTEEDVPLLALNLYLDFINLFYSLLRFLGYSK